MKKNPKTVFTILFILLTIGGFSQNAKAQGAIVYRFLEVVDHKGKPVTGAKVTTEGFGVKDDELRTNEKGQLDGGLPVSVGDFNTESFTVKKEGYFPFKDIYGIVRSHRKKIKIELLLIPKNKKEQKATGDEQSKREFFAAAKSGDVLAVRKFLDAGFDPNLSTSQLRGIPAPLDEPIILYSVASGSGPTVKEFLLAGVDISKDKELFGDILLRYLETYPSSLNYPDTETGRGQKIMDYEDGAIHLIEAGADINVTSGSTNLLMIAAKKDYPQTVKLLIEKGIPVNAKDRYGLNALMYLITNHQDVKTRLEIAELLLRSGVDINTITNKSNTSSYNDNCTTALMFAVKLGNLQMTNFLITNGAEINKTCKERATPLTYLKKTIYFHPGEEIRDKLIKLLEENGAI